MTPAATLMEQQSTQIPVEARPWGTFHQFTHNAPSTVKILDVHPEGLLSYQWHEHREEHWFVLAGAGYAIINDEHIPLETGDTLKIKPKDKHRLGSKTGITVMEISLGDFDENDNHRLEDIYKRDSPA